MNRHIQVLHREKKAGGRGKTGAMNAGFRLSIGDIVLYLDADYYPQVNIIEKLVAPFTEQNVGAVQGRVVVLNEPQNIVTRLVALERIGGYRVDQEARDSLGLIAQFGGTVGGFRRSLLEQLGGWDESILAEDTDLTFRVSLAGYRVRYAGDAECYEEAVDNWRAYWTQRYRWARGHMQCCFRHSFSVIRSKKLSLKAKVDGLLLLNVYFMPLVVLMSLVVGLPLIFLESSTLVNALWFSVPIALYSFVGNFAPFFEVGVGAHLDGRRRIQWLMPMLMFAFLYNIPICFKAFVDLLSHRVMGKQHSAWAKTVHLGYGTCYITNQNVALEVAK
jgi:cellulose synthase/poly-beta-1,6-N-acetylglucosamine synthase-like glycosyltransferase